MSLEPIQKGFGTIEARLKAMRYDWELTVARHLHAKHILSGNATPDVPFELDPCYNASVRTYRTSKDWAVSIIGSDRCGATSHLHTARGVYARRVLSLLKPDYRVRGERKLDQSDAEKAARAAERASSVA